MYIKKTRVGFYPALVFHSLAKVSPQLLNTLGASLLPHQKTNNQITGIEIVSLNKDRWLFVVALNLVRIALGSYFIGVSLDLISGVDQRALFLPYMTYEWADLVGSGLLFCISVAFMTGIMTRTYALTLAMFIMCSSVVQNFLPYHPAHLIDFWRDITLSAAVLMAFTNIGRVELKKLSMPERALRNTSAGDRAKSAAQRMEAVQSDSVQ